MCLGADLHERFPHSMVMKAGPQLLHRARQTVKTPEQRQAKAALSPTSRFHDLYSIFIQWLMTQLNRKNNIKVHGLVTHLQRNAFHLKPLGVSICFTLFISSKCREFYLHDSTARCKMEPDVRNHLTRAGAIVPDSCQTNFDAGFWQAADYPVHHVLCLCNLKKGKQGADTHTHIQ